MPDMTGKEGVDEVFDVVGPAGPEDEPVTIAVRVHVQPGAGRTSIIGRHGDAIKLKVAAPPEGGRANEAAATLLATTLGVKRDAVAMTSGATSRTKRFEVQGVELGAVRRLLAEAMASEGGGNAQGRHGVR
jgi:uncharacterized protein (TIGR00251 family)